MASTILAAAARARRRARARHKHGEFVTTEAGDVLLRKRLAESRPDADQHLVARLVAEAVVDLLEAVEVEHEQRARGCLAEVGQRLLRISSWRRRRLIKPVSESWFASCSMAISKRRRSVTSRQLQTRPCGVPSRTKAFENSSTTRPSNSSIETVSLASGLLPRRSTAATNTQAQPSALASPGK